MVFQPKRLLHPGETTQAYIPPEDATLSFTPYGMIGSWHSGIFHKFYTSHDVTKYKPALVSTRDDGRAAAVYFADYEAAKAAEAELHLLEKAADSEARHYIINGVLRYTAAVKDLLNIDQARFDRSPVVAHDIQIMGLRSQQRHHFHLYALPSAVAAAAEFVGLEVPRNNPLRKLLLKDIVLDEALAESMIGKTKAGKGEEGYWLNSELGQWRTELWAMLGESDPTKSLPTGSKDAKQATQAEALSYCLGIAGAGWKNPLWARMVQVPNVDIDATNKTTGKRYGIACIWQFFGDQTEAQRTVDSEKRATVDETVGTTTSSSDEPKIPPEWTEVPDEWRGVIAETLNKDASRSNQDIASELSVGTPYVALWRKHLGL